MIPTATPTLIRCRAPRLLSRIAASTTTDVSPRPRHRSYVTSTTPQRFAHPSKFVSGVTPAMLESDPALRAWFDANLPPDWETSPDIDTLPPAPTPRVVTPMEARNIRPLSAYLRCGETEEGSRACRKLRVGYDNGGLTIPLIPGILHGSDPTTGVVGCSAEAKVLVKTPWFEVQRELDRYHHSFEGRVYAMTVYDDYDEEDEEHEPEVVMEDVLVLPSGLQLHPWQHRAYCLNYVRYHPSKPIPLPIRLVNEEESPAMKRGGFLAPISRTIDCLVEDGAPIPECIELECTGLRAKEVVRMDRLVFPDGVTVHPRVDGKKFLCGTVFGSRGAGAAEDDEAKEGGEGDK